VRAHLKQDGELAPIASNKPRLGGSMHGYTSWGAPNAKGTSRARDRSRLKHRRCRLKQIPRPLVKIREKNPAGALTLLQGFGG
jgi:hypothetical protein